MGRKPIPIEPYIDKLEHAILLGATYELAAQYAGISVATFERWREQALTASPGTVLARLHDRLQQAEGQAAIGWLSKIEQAAEQGDWRAAMWKLEKRYPESYGREPVRKVALTSPDGTQAALPQLQIVLTQEPPAQS